jgi:hypothetical protein
LKQEAAELKIKNEADKIWTELQHEQNRQAVKRARLIWS